MNQRAIQSNQINNSNPFHQTSHNPLQSNIGSINQIDLQNTQSFGNIPNQNPLNNNNFNSGNYNLFQNQFKNSALLNNNVDAKNFQYQFSNNYLTQISTPSYFF